MGSGDNETLDNEQGDEGDLSGDNPSDQEEGGLDYSGDLDPEEDLGQSFDQYSGSLRTGYARARTGSRVRNI